MGISLAGTAAVILLLTLLSGRIVRPIAESYEKQKRFITDAGHELKTPITIIRADADVLEAELEGESEWITDIRRQTQRLADLTAELIYLSRMEEESVVIAPCPTFRESHTRRARRGPPLRGKPAFSRAGAEQSLVRRTLPARCDAPGRPADMVPCRTNGPVS